MMNSLRELGMSSLLKKRIRENMITIFQHLRGYHKDERIGLVSKATEGRTRSNEWKLREIQPRSKGNFFDSDND